MQNKFKETSINIAISFDEGYVPFVFVLLSSVFKHNVNSDIYVHAIAPEITPSASHEITNFVEENFAKIFFYKLDKSSTQGFALPNHESSYFTLANYYRLFFADLVPNDLDKLLYLDIDTLVVGNLNELMQIDLEGFAVGAVQDIEMHLRTDLGIDKLTDYFNSGVMLIDLHQWRVQQVTEHACNIILEYPDKIRGWVDQDALNMLFKGNWYHLDWRYNLMNGYIPHDLPRRDYNKFLTQKNIIHYNGTPKPWHRACESRFRYLYQQYARHLPQAHLNSPGKKLTWQDFVNLLQSRVLETYFNYPEVGLAWRRLKALMGR
jgi:lipopolysaccharide biosynthesis glycosyltransferase